MPLNCVTFKDNLRKLTNLIKSTKYKWEFEMYGCVSAVAVYVRVNGVSYPLGFTDQEGIEEVRRIFDDARRL